MTDQTSPETETPEFLYARDLLVSFVEEHCDPVPEWKPNGDLMGILMQFDNALTVVRSIKAGFDPKQPREGGWNAERAITDTSTDRKPGLGDVQDALQPKAGS